MTLTQLLLCNCGDSCLTAQMLDRKGGQGFCKGKSRNLLRVSFAVKGRRTRSSRSWKRLRVQDSTFCFKWNHVMARKPRQRVAK